MTHRGFFKLCHTLDKCQHMAVGEKERKNLPLGDGTGSKNHVSLCEGAV